MNILARITVGAILYCGVACGQSTNPGPAPENEPDWLVTRWRARIAQDAAQKHITRSPQDPVLKDLAGLFEEIRPALPDGRVNKQADVASKKALRLQVQTVLDETPNTRFVRALNLEVEKLEDSPAAQERLVIHLQTPAVYEGGPVQGPEPGQLCYHSADSGRASEIFIRENLVVALHCIGPVTLPKPQPGNTDPRRRISERTSVQGFCSEIVAPLALQIDRIIQNRLERR